jgi:4-carboxymuconolactone decarboxylase
LERLREPQTGTAVSGVTTRKAHVQGTAPRIDAIPNKEIDSSLLNLVNRLRESAGAGRVTQIPEFMRLMAKHPSIFRCQMEMGTALFHGHIPPRERELAVLRVSWLSGTPFEWGEHVEIGKRCGLSGEEVERVTQGSCAPGWSEHEAAVVRGVEELFADFAVSDATWAILAKSWNEPQLIEYPMMVGQYLATAFILNSLRVQPEEWNRGLAHR